jgi:hypothetical protein
MFNSSILDVAIGLVFCFASVALLVSAVNEAIASALKLRHKALLAGIKKMLNDPNASGLVAKLYNHALISPLATGSPSTTVVPSVLPAYIPSQAFAAALVDVIQQVPGDVTALKGAIDALPDPQLKQLLQGFMARGQDRIDAFYQQLAGWFDNAMDRLSGSYKRRTQVATFVLGLGVAGAFNIDTFYVLSELWARPSTAAAISNPGVAAMIASAASATATTAPTTSGTDRASPPFRAEDWMQTLRTLPVGWDNGRKMPGLADHVTFYFFYVVGLIVTASSAVFGAPFWFDLLQRLVQIRGTGTKPPADRDKDKVTSAATR